MKTSALKTFAQEARVKLIAQVGARLELVLGSDSAVLREKAEAVAELKKAIQNSSKEQVIDKVAYTWFNRLVALRFMDANDYQPIGVQVLTPKEGYTLPELLDEAKQGHIPEELPVFAKHVYDLLEGRIPSSNAQNEAYKELLIGACNHLHTLFPFLFEALNDYAELLLPDDLISEFSIVHDVRAGMSEEDCHEVEVIGWLYQFYISEINEELISSKKKYAKKDLAPASQLFTPKWIVQYMVDNTLGQLWSEIEPKTRVTDSLEYYIKPAYREQNASGGKRNVEELKFFDPCVGSGHILSYAFDVFYRIYEEQGYAPSEIPKLIISKNLFGTDIDERAAQLASFVLLMKGRQKSRRFLREVQQQPIQPNITFYQDFEFDNKFKNASALGSLIRVEPKEAQNFKVEKDSLFGERQKALKKLYSFLGQRYDVVVTNPPYISASRMEGSLKQYVETHYPEAKTDLFATFILRCLELCNPEGMAGYMTPFVWMFIVSYKGVREAIIGKHFINNLIQLEYSGFDGATVPICTFTLTNRHVPNGTSSFIRLSDFRGAKLQGPKTIEAISNPDCGWKYESRPDKFKQIDGSPFAYWLSDTMLNVLAVNEPIGKLGKLGKGSDTGNNARFIRFWWELDGRSFSFQCASQGFKFYPTHKGGGRRKWYGNTIDAVNWENEGEEMRGVKNSNIRNLKNYFEPCITWGKISSGAPSFRFVEQGSIADDAGPSGFFNESLLTDILLILNSKISVELMKLFSPTLTFTVGSVSSIPFVQNESNELDGRLPIRISRLDWDAHEISWNHRQNELVRIGGSDIEESFSGYVEYWSLQYYRLHEFETKNNERLIQTFGLGNELTPEVRLEEITILQDNELDRGELVALNKSVSKAIDHRTLGGNENLKLPFNSQVILAQFLSYGVGCMFGRYSLDKEGLILADQDETLEVYLKKVGKKKDEVTFLPDDDNIIPVLDDEWFEDDIVGRFHEFLKATFGKPNFEKNLAFVEECLGKDIRKYFVKDFYADHIKRYSKRPIYWMFSSPKGAFNVLVYMHRYTPDTLNRVLNNYLKEYREKLNTRTEHLDHLIETGSASQQTKAAKEKDKLKAVLLELQEYERDVLYLLATERIAIDLDDGVLVNYNKFGKAIKEVAGLNDKKAKAKVKQFDWIDTKTIR